MKCFTCGMFGHYECKCPHRKKCENEGHIIKNAKSKVTTAVKQLKAEHRLILSGTPIQVVEFVNCILEKYFC